MSCDPLVITDYNNISPELCYKLIVWNLQCRYSTLVNNYLLNMQYGGICEGQFERLIMYRRLLKILNRYDVRDIVSNTTEYNAITYNEIKEIIEYLQNKY